jgi:hypothetical protein
MAGAFNGLPRELRIRHNDCLQAWQPHFFYLYAQGVMRNLVACLRDENRRVAGNRRR